MKAIRIHQFGGPEVLKLEEIPDPKPGPGQVVVRAKAIGVNPADTYVRAGIFGDRPMPFIPGYDAAGVIEAVGAEVKQFRVGDRVYLSASSAYAELIVADPFQVHPLPLKISFEQGAALGTPYGTASYALFQRGQAQPGEWVLVHGASGSVGSAATQLARAHGLTVVGTASTPKGRELAKQEGAHHVLDHHSPDYLDQLMRLTEGKGVALVLEMLANVNLGKDLKVLAKNGRVVVIGSRGKVEIDPRDAMSRNVDIRGMSIFNTTPEDLAKVHATVIEGLEKGSLRPVIGETFSLAEAAAAHRKVMEPGAYGKIVLVP